MRNFLLLLIFVFTGSFIFAQADICNVEFEIGTRSAAFTTDQNVVINFDYSVDEPGGVRIFPRPFTGGMLTPGYAASGSPLYSGTGTGDGFFNISGNTTVDEVRFQIFNADQSVKLREFWVPVDYHYGDFGINEFSYSHDPRLASLLLDEQFVIDFKYDVKLPEGVRIFIRPMTDGALTPGYGASGSPVFTGAGSTSMFFTISSGVNVHVDQLRVKVVSPDQSTEHLVFYVPVNLFFSTVKVDNIVASGSNFPLNGSSRTISYDYETTESDGVRIFPRPWTNGGLTPGYGACGSGVYTGSGSGSCNFTINEGNQRVDHMRFQVVNPDQSQVLLEFLSPVEYTFGDFLIENIELCPPPSARLLPGENININYDLYNDEGVNARIFVRPFTEGALTPGYAASGSPSYVPGSGSGDDFFTINGDGVTVDQIRFMITNDDQSETLAEYFIPVDYYFGGEISTAVNEAAEEQSVLHSMKVYPNPATSFFEVSFLLDEPQVVQVSLKDQLGRLVAQLDKGTYLAKVEQRIPLKAADFNLSPGMYFVELKGEHFRESRTIVLVN